MSSDYIKQDNQNINPLIEKKDTKYYLDPKIFSVNIPIQLSEESIYSLNKDRIIVVNLTKLVGKNDEGDSLVNELSSTIKRFIGSEIFLRERTDSFMKEPLHFMFHTISIQAPIPGDDTATVDSFHVGLALPTLGYHLQNHKNEIEGFPNYQMFLDQSGKKDLYFTDKCVFPAVLNTSSDKEVILAEPKDLFNSKAASFHVGKDGKTIPGANSYHLAYVNPETVHPSEQPVLSNQVVAGRNGAVTTEHLMTVSADSWIATWSDQSKSSLVGQTNSSSKVIKVQELLDQKTKFYNRQAEQRCATLDNIGLAFGLPGHVSIPTGSAVNLLLKITLNGIYPQEVIDMASAPNANFSKLSIVSIPLNEHE